MVGKASQPAGGVYRRNHHVLIMELRFVFDQPSAFARVDSMQDEQRLTLGLPNALLAGTGVESWPLAGPGEVEQLVEMIIWRGINSLIGIAAVEVNDKEVVIGARGFHLGPARDRDRADRRRWRPCPA